MSIEKKEKLEIIRNILDGIEEYWMDSKGFIIATNLEATAITGYVEAEIIGKHFSILYSKEEREAGMPEKDLNHVIKVGPVKKKVIRLKKNDVKFLAKVSMELRGKDTSGLGIHMTVQDATYKAIKNHKIKTLQSHLDSIFNNNFIGVINLLKKDFKIINTNAKACEITGDFESIGKNFTAFLSDTLSLEKFKEYVISGNTDDIELSLLKPDGASSWVTAKCAFIEDEEIVQVLLFDITDEKKRIAELERINNRLDQFIYHASHDLRSPLTTLLGLLDLSKKEKNSIQSIHTYIDMMTERTLHLDSLLADLTSIAFNEKASIESSVFDLRTEIEEIFEDYLGTDNPVKATLEIIGTSNFVSDVKRMRMILRNLISNAVKYSNPSQPAPLVSVRINLDEFRMKMEVEDNGIGIYPAYLTRVFEMFFRGTNRASGSGLGLYIVKEMVDKLDGEIGVTSTPGVGSIFTVAIPNMLEKKLKPSKRKPQLL